MAELRISAQSLSLARPPSDETFSAFALLKWRLPYSPDFPLWLVDQPPTPSVQFPLSFTRLDFVA